MEAGLGVEVDRTSDAPLYEQVRDCVLENIASGKWPPHLQLPPYRTLSKEIGVSMITIKHSFGALVKEGVLYRKRGVGVFVSPPRAALHTGTIGLLLPDVRHSFFAALAHAIQNHAASRQYATVFFSLCGTQEGATHTVELLPRQILDGIITCTPIVERFPAQFAQITAEKQPVVFVDGRSPEGRYDYVGTDNLTGLELALDHLIGLGHKRLGFIAGHVRGHILTSGARERIGYFEQILRTHGLPFSPPQALVSAQDGELAGEEAGYIMLSLRESPTAIMCMNDLVAAGVIRVAKRLGVRCPEDLSVVGFDDLDICAHLDPPLTTIRQPVTAIGETVVDLLLDKVNNPVSGKPKAILLQPELVIRSSTAPAPG